MRASVIAGVLGAGLLAGGCGATAASDPPATPASAAPHYGHASAGGLRVTHGYVPEPASPAVAAAYFTVRNTGTSADTLTRVSSLAAASAALHRYEKSGGAERMVPLHGGLRIPAHGTVTLHPGGTHVMLSKPGDQVREGRHVTLRLTFRHAGTVPMTVPVTASSGMAGMDSGGMDSGRPMPS